MSDDIMQPVTGKNVADFQQASPRGSSIPPGATRWSTSGRWAPYTE